MYNSWHYTVEISYCSLEELTKHDYGKECASVETILQNISYNATVFSSDEAHFHLSSCVNKQNFHYWVMTNSWWLQEHILIMNILLCDLLFWFWCNMSIYFWGTWPCSYSNNWPLHKNGMQLSAATIEQIKIWLCSSNWMVIQQTYWWMCSVWFNLEVTFHGHLVPLHLVTSFFKG